MKISIILYFYCKNCSRSFNPI